MIILSRPGFVIKSHYPSPQVSYPSKVQIEVTLSPADFFGVAPLSGMLSIVPAQTPLRVEKTDYRGPDRLKISGSFPMMNFSSTFLGQRFRMAGNIASFSIIAPSYSYLSEFLVHLDDLFPSLFSGALPAPIEVEGIQGTLGSVPFAVSGICHCSQSVLVVKPERSLKEYFDLFAPQKLPIQPLVSALRYIQQADRLESEGRYMTTFLGERILNIAKALEALFPGDKVDDMKGHLGLLGVASTYSDIFASVRYLRSQVDVGHVSFTDLPEGKLQEVYDFARLATSCARSLVNSIIRDEEKQKLISRLRKNCSLNKFPDAVSYLRKYNNVAVPANDDLGTVKLQPR